MSENPEGHLRGFLRPIYQFRRKELSSGALRGIADCKFMERKGDERRNEFSLQRILSVLTIATRLLRLRFLGFEKEIERVGHDRK
jgi:hypothetical protein